MKKVSLILILSTLFLFSCSYEDVDYDINLNEEDFEKDDVDDKEEKETDKINEEIVEKSKEESSLKQFNNCLADNGMIIYGANWCGACISLVETLGGYDKVENVYIECTENQQLCQDEKITRYPTIRIYDEPYTDQRTLESFSQKTGCELPV